MSTTTVGRFVTTRALQGVAFHTGMNAFEHARRKPERVAWGLGSFARSVALFEVLGGVSLLQHRWPIENAVLRHAAALGEETLGLSLLGLGEVWLRGGDGQDALELLENNLQFLLAMRLLSGARWAAGGFEPEVAQSLGQRRARALRQLRRSADPDLSREESGRLARHGLMGYMEWLDLLMRENAELYRDKKSVASPEIRPRGEEVTVNRAGLRSLAQLLGRSEAWTRRAIKGGGFFDPHSNLDFIERGARARRPGLPGHERLHRRVVATDRAAWAEMVETYRRSDVFELIQEHPQLDGAAIEMMAGDPAFTRGRDPASMNLEELLALEAEQALPADLHEPFARLLDTRGPSGRTLRQQLRRADLLPPAIGRGAWLRRGASLRAPIRQWPIRPASPRRAPGLEELWKSDEVQRLDEIDPADLDPSEEPFNPGAQRPPIFYSHDTELTYADVLPALRRVPGAIEELTEKLDRHPELEFQSHVTLGEVAREMGMSIPQVVNFGLSRGSDAYAALKAEELRSPEVQETVRAQQVSIFDLNPQAFDAVLHTLDSAWITSLMYAGYMPYLERALEQDGILAEVTRDGDYCELKSAPYEETPRLFKTVLDKLHGVYCYCQTHLHCGIPGEVTRAELTAIARATEARIIVEYLQNDPGVEGAWSRYHVYSTLCSNPQSAGDLRGVLRMHLDRFDGPSGPMHDIEIRQYEDLGRGFDHLALVTRLVQARKRLLQPPDVEIDRIHDHVTHNLHGALVYLKAVFDAGGRPELQEISAQLGSFVDEIENASPPSTGLKKRYIPEGLRERVGEWMQEVDLVEMLTVDAFLEAEPDRPE